MTSDNEIIKQIARKLCLTDEKQIVSKTSELLRRLEGKTFTGPKFGDYAKTVIGIDLATDLLGMHIDLKSAVKISGLSKTEYARYKRTFETLLNITKTIDIPKICVQLGLSHVQNTAQKLFDEYKRFHTANNGNEGDLTHPQYNAMAVYQACKKEKAKVIKSKIIAFSNLKPQQWESLEKSWDKICAQIQTQKTIDKKLDENQKLTAEKPMGTIDIHHQERKTSHRGRLENYDDFRERIMRQAFDKLCESHEIEYIRIHALSKICNLNMIAVDEARKLFRKYMKIIGIDEKILSEPKYSALAVYNVMKDEDMFDIRPLIEYSGMKETQWKRFIKESELVFSDNEQVSMTKPIDFKVHDFEMFEKFFSS